MLLIPCDHVDSAAAAIFVFTFWGPTFQACNTLARWASRVARFIRNVTSIFISNLTQNLRRATLSVHIQSDGIPDCENTHHAHKQPGPAPSHSSPKRSLYHVVEDLKTRLTVSKWWDMSTRWHMMSEKQLSIHVQGRNYDRGNQQINGIPMASPWILAGAPRLWRSVMQIHLVSQEPARLHMRKAPFHGTFFSIGSS